MGRKNLDIIKFRGGYSLTGTVDKAPFSIFLNCGSILDERSGVSKGIRKVDDILP